MTMEQKGDFIPFSIPDIGQEEVDEVVDSMLHGWVTTGPKMRRFEEDFAASLGGDVHAIAVNSATAGLHLAVEAIGLGPGDEVITTPYTFTATAEVIRYLGATPVFVDIDRRTFNIDPGAIEAKITSRTKAILPVHFAGLACDMEPILAIARRHSLRVIEDAAHSLPTTYRGAMVGALSSDATVFSFYSTKTMTTGEGGMVVTRDQKLAARCRVMRLHGIDRDAFSRYNSDKPAWYYEVIAPGYKYNMTDIAAAMGIHQLRKVWAFQKRREQIRDLYDSTFADLPVILPPRAPEGDVHACHLYVLRLRADASLTREKFIEAMATQRVSTSVHFIPLFLHPYWRDTYKLRPEDFPNSMACYRGAVSLPNYTKMTDAQVERVAKVTRQLLGS
jgi:dTDP-4-amino-4,6-dideoxygalactose transaminase